MGKLLQPEPDTAVKPMRAERVALVADIHVEFPYSADGVCKKCGRALSRYNPHTLCYACVDAVRRIAHVTGNRELLRTVDERRRRNPKFRRPSPNLNTAFFERVASAGDKRTHHHPQSGHN